MCEALPHDSLTAHPRGPAPRRGRDVFARYENAVRKVESVLAFVPVVLRLKLVAALRHRSGLVAMGFRYALLASLSGKCGANVSVHPGVWLLAPRTLILGSNISIHPMAYIDATGGVSIGDNVSIAHGVTIMSSEHRFARTDLPIKDQGVDLMTTTIGNNVWLGARAIILGGVSIGDDAIVGAGAVVTRDVPPGAIAVGVPARVVGQRA